MNWLIFWIGALATYRLTLFVSRDRGPGAIFVKLRNNFYVGVWAKCPFCVSPYAAVLVCVLMELDGVVETFPMWILLALAWSSITICIDRTFTADVTNN